VTRDELKWFRSLTAGERLAWTKVHEQLSRVLFICCPPRALGLIVKFIDELVVAADIKTIPELLAKLKKFEGLRH